MKKNPHNFMEEVVKKLIDKAIKDLNICKCEKCRVDIMALTLNELVPKYFVTKKGMNYTKLNCLDPQFEADVISTIVKAADIVRKNPKHDKE